MTAEQLQELEDLVRDLEAHLQAGRVGLQLIKHGMERSPLN